MQLSVMKARLPSFSSDASVLSTSHYFSNLLLPDGYLCVQNRRLRLFLDGSS